MLFTALSTVKSCSYAAEDDFGHSQQPGLVGLRW